MVIHLYGNIIYVMDDDNPIANALRYVARINQMLEPIRQQITDYVKPIQDQMKELAKTYSDLWKQWIEENKEQTRYLANKGWFPNQCLLFKEIPENCDIDEFLCSVLEEGLDKIEDEMTEIIPDRSEILKEAFKLHREERYIASIPLFLSQADGIFTDSFNLKFFRIKGNHKLDIEKILKEEEIIKTPFISFYLEALGATSHLKGDSVKASKNPDRGPNRNGILHGCSHNLNYGTRLNSFKAISFLSFTYVLSVVIKKDES